MKKSLILTSLLAIVATGAAKAETDVTFGGKYDLLTNTGDVQPGVVTTAPADITYNYDVTDGSSITGVNADVNYANAPDVTKFTFVDPDGATHDVSFENRYDKSDYVGTTAVTGAGYGTTQNIVAGAEVSESNYSYTYTLGGEDIARTLDNPSRFIGEMTALSGDYANAISVNVVNGEAFINGDTTALTNASDLDYTLYGFTLGDSYYNLDKEGGSFILVRNGENVTPASGSDLETQFNNAQAAYATDVGTLGTNIATTASNWATEKTYYDTAKGFFDTDKATVATLTNNYDSQDKADKLYSDAQKKQDDAKRYQNENIANYNAAVELYNTPIETVQAATLQDAKDYADSLASNYDAAGAADAEQTRAVAAENTLQANINAEANARAAADTTLQNNIDAEATARAAADTTLQNNINAEADARAAADTTLQNNIDNEVARATAQEAAIRGEFAAADAATLSKANSYTDSRVNTLEKNVSGGVAAATALSSVEVSNVKKGEVSLGGGYGYYNSQSAMAFGAAMGLSDNWSINAGAGIASGDKTQVAFRAGTNYKFKLF